MSDRLPPGVSPETFALHGGYDPAQSMGAIKPPMFATSTFVAESSEELARWFRQAYGLDDGHPGQPDGLIYSRLVNPNLQIFEERWSVFERTEQSALFASGMAAITTALLALCRQGDQVVYSAPVYGGTDYFLTRALPAFGIGTHAFLVTDTVAQVHARLAAAFAMGPVRVVYIETPANPTLALADIRGIVAECAKMIPRPIVIVDSTVLGPIYHRPIELGVDLVVHSATKSIGGHSDLIAGIASGSNELVSSIKAFRTILGTMAAPFTAWLLLRSLEEYHARVETTGFKALKVARFLRKHPAVDQLYFPGMTRNREQARRFREQCEGRGSLMSFTVRGGREEAYRVLDALRIVKLAVSLGGTESLAEHPRTHTHSDLTEDDLNRYGIDDAMIRLSVGLEKSKDVIADLDQALALIR